MRDNSKKTPNPQHLVNAYRRLRRDSKTLSRKHKGSTTNRRKTHIHLAVQHKQVANARADFQHKLSRNIINENQAVISETLKTANMMKNKRLARYIGDAELAWFRGETALNWLVPIWSNWSSGSPVIKHAIVAVTRWQKCH